jgi:hypothetical protein
VPYSRSADSRILHRWLSALDTWAFSLRDSVCGGGLGGSDSAWRGLRRARGGATRAALALAELGFQVKEMLGGFEYWAQEGFAYETWQGGEKRDSDPLTAPVHADD